MYILLLHFQWRRTRWCHWCHGTTCFWSRSIKKSRKVSKSKSRSLEWHQLFLPSFGANDDLRCIIYTLLPMFYMWTHLQHFTFVFANKFHEAIRERIGPQAIDNLRRVFAVIMEINWVA